MQADSLPLQGPRESSVYATLPASQEDLRNSTRPFEKAREIEDGIEVVPIELPNTPAPSWSGKQLATDEEEKEVVPTSKTTATISKPLPSIPRPKWKFVWDRISLKYRIIILVCIQASMLLSTCLGMISVSRRYVPRSSEAESNTLPSTPPIPSLKSGPYLVMSGRPEQESAACLAQNNESAAWTCRVAAPVFQLRVLPSPADRKDMTIISLSALKNKTNYGLQPPQLDAISLSQATDPESPDYGPAYHFRTTYTRIVILNENQIINQSEAIAPFRPDYENIRRGDRPWVCMFNNTQLEGYIYASRLSKASGLSQAWSFGNDTADMMSFLPVVMKITEERVNGTQPYCVHKEMKDDGRLVPAMTDGGMMMLRLNETATPPDREGTQDNCRCQWLVE